VRILLIAVGRGMPAWVAQGFGEYARRMPPHCPLELVEVPAGKRGKHADTARIQRGECRRVLAAVPAGARLIALDERGQAWKTRQLADRLAGWLQEGADVALLVGGPDGLGPDCRHQAQGLWSLSALTLPHMLVRVVVAEQLYRAWSIVSGHPYHRV
jgi:23S rRNA (pseudouridine1915-N3)-methyltransferase